MNITHKMASAYQGLKSGLLEPSAASAAAPVCNLATADLFYPEQAMPASVQQAVTLALSDPELCHYPHPLGWKPLRQTIADRLQRRYGHPVDPDRNILVTAGSEAGLLCSFLPFLEEGDEVLIPDPSYPTNAPYTRLAGGTPVFVPLREEDGFALNVQDFESRCTERTKAVVLTCPNNPTGTVFSRQSLEMLCQWIVRRDLVLICDHAFEDYIFDGDFVWAACLPGMWERTVTVFTLSKGAGLCGLRVGYMVADTPVLDALLARVPPVMCAAGSLSQVAAKAALEDESTLLFYKEKLARRLSETCRILSDIPGLTFTVPQGGFQMWLNVSQLGSSSQIVSYLREKAGVLVNRGDPFGPLCGKDHLRLVFGCVQDDETYFAAIKRIAEALKQYSS